MGKTMVKLFVGSDPDKLTLSVNEFIATHPGATFHHAVAGVNQHNSINSPIVAVHTVLVVYEDATEEIVGEDVVVEKPALKSTLTVYDFIPGQEVVWLPGNEYGKVSSINEHYVHVRFKNAEGEYKPNSQACKAHDLCHVPIKES